MKRLTVATLLSLLEEVPLADRGIPILTVDGEYGYGYVSIVSIQEDALVFIDPTSESLEKALVIE